jgi:hypothetical protein
MQWERHEERPSDRKGRDTSDQKKGLYAKGTRSERDTRQVASGERERVLWMQWGEGEARLGVDPYNVPVPLCYSCKQDSRRIYRWLLVLDLDDN